MPRPDRRAVLYKALLTQALATVKNGWRTALTGAKTTAAQEATRPSSRSHGQEGTMARLRRTPPGPSDVTRSHHEPRVTSLAPGMAAQTRGCNPHAYKSAATPALPCLPLPRPRGRQRGILQPGFFLCRLRCSSERAQGSAACFGSQSGKLGRWNLPRTGARVIQGLKTVECLNVWDF